MRAVLVALAAGAALAAAVPALAVDRSLGPGVPKPAVTGTPWTDAEISSLDANVDIALAGSKALRGAHVGIYAIDARDGRVLYERNQDDLFQPASTFKLLVGSAALDKLGPDFRLRTDAYVGGPVSGGEALGPLVLRGGGDVLLDDAAFAGLGAALGAAGISAVHGVGFDEPAGLVPYLPGWTWDDLAWYYAAPVTRLGLNDNQVTLRVTPAAVPGAPVGVTVEPWGTVCAPGAAPCPDDLGFVIRSEATTGPAGAASTLDVTRRMPPTALDEVVLTGALAADAKPERLAIAVPSPPRYAAFAARRALAASGFRVLPELAAPARGGASGAAVSAAASSAAAPVWTHDSEPLRDLLADLWLPSDNLLAEELLRTAGATAPARQGSSEDGIAYEKAWLARLGIDPARLAIADGSGLSAYDRIAPRDLVTILKHDWDGPHRELILDDLPLAGVRGTLASSFTGTAAEKRIFAKTGTLSRASALAGYAANDKHGALIFAFQVDEWVGEGAELRELRGRILAMFVGR